MSTVGSFGLTLVNSLFIDPLYPGPDATAPLELGLVNLNDSSAAIPAGTALGKVAFFDISDSGPITLMPGSDIAIKFAHRQAMSRGEKRS